MPHACLYLHCPLTELSNYWYVGETLHKACCCSSVNHPTSICTTSIIASLPVHCLQTDDSQALLTNILTPRYCQHVGSYKELTTTLLHTLDASSLQPHSLMEGWLLLLISLPASLQTLLYSSSRASQTTENCCWLS